MKRRLLLLVFLSIFGGILSPHTSLRAQAPDSTGTLILDDEISLEDLMNVPVTVASRNALSLRESPGIITVITDEEIKNMGARDLIDVLRFVPGMEFAQDVQNYVGLGIRGNWASEGKVAVFVDGIAMNEILYATIPFGNHFSVDQIRKIEIIRGPGSAMYGGVAELAVINIITKQAEMNGVQASAMYGQMQHGMGRASGSLAAGKEFKNGVNAYLKTWYSRTNRGDGTYYQQDDLSRNFNMIGNHEIINFTVDGGISYKGLSFNFLVDQYNPKQRNGSGLILPYSINNRFNYYSGNLKYEWKISEKFKLTPLYQYTYQLPWASTDSVYSYSNRFLQRHIARVEASYDPHKNINLLAGVQFLNDYGNSKPSPYSNTYTYYYAPNNSPTINYQNYSGYLQAFFKTKIVNVTAGARYDKHSLGFDAFVPRFALTKVVHKVHFKLLAAQAFRTPYIQNISSDSIRPEKATIFEAEVGYQIGKKVNVSMNVFDISIKDALYYVYYENPVTGAILDGYYNGKKTGTRGIELVAKYKDKWGYVDVNYSYYTNAGKNQIPEFAVDKSLFRDPSQSGINTNANMGFAPHKLNILVNFKITKHLNWNINANYLSKRFAYDHTQSGDTAAYMKAFPSMLLLNTFVNYENLFVNGLDLGVGCYNIANTGNPFLTPYTSSISPMPGSTREFVVKLKYRIGGK